MSKKIDITLYTDKYFLRSYEILKKENLNPYVRAQIFIRKGPGILYGIKESLDFIKSNSNIESNGGHIYTLLDGMEYKSLETIMIIEGYILDII